MVLSCALAWLACEEPAKREFSTPTYAPSRTGLLALSEGLLVGNEGGRLMRLSPSGQVMWQVSLGREVAARPAVVGDVVVTSTVSGEWMGLGLATGEERWRRAEQPAAVASLLAAGEQVIALGADGAVRSLDATSGATSWRRALGESPRDGAALVVGSPSSPPRAVVATGESISVLEVGDGRILWRQRPGAVGIAVYGESLLALSSGGALSALAIESGANAWRIELGAAPTAGPCLLHGSAWVGLSSGELVAIDPATGQRRGSLVLPAPASAPPAAYQDLLLVPLLGREGRLLAHRPFSSAVAFELRVDSALRASPLVQGDRVFLLPSDGRVLGYRLNPAAIARR